MSTYYGDAFHPVTGKPEKALFIDDYFGRRIYGIQFSDGSTYREEDVKYPDPLDEPVQDPPKQ